MRQRIFRNLFFIAFASVLLASVLIMGVLYGVFTDRQWQELKSETAYAAAGLSVAPDREAYLAAAAAADSTRLTLVSAEGTVLYDSAADSTAMENHAGRPEIMQALQSGAGKSARPSDTLGQERLYYAQRLADGTVLRLSDTQKSIWGVLMSLVPALIGMTALTLIICALLARGMTRHIVRPLNSLNLDEPLNNDVYDELAPLLSRLEAQKRQIEGQMRELNKRRDEFAAIADNMREGLLVLNAHGVILAINRSAQRLFHADGRSAAGRHVLTLDRSLKLQNALEQAARGTPAEQLLSLHARQYQLLASPVREGGNITGIVMLILDVTEHQAQERMRREFSANVSHELKTPLTSISGYAEIMMGGVAKPEDMPGFARRIYEESTRLIALVEDIIRLSRLDEGGGELPWESVELYALAEGVADRLAAVASAQSVSVDVRGEPVTVQGVRQVLEEMLYNLTDNGIRYNRPGGRVEIAVSPESGGGAEVIVSDTGIGIPREHHERVFERFYRVDQSHAKLTGGTGLGLAIVKRGALLHGARLSLESEEGQGTKVRIRFPAGKQG